MPEETNPSAAIITTSKPEGKKNVKILGVIAGVIVLSLGIFLGLILVRQRQTIQKKASTDPCPGAEQCPGPEIYRLKNCHPPEADNSPQESLCNQTFKGRIEPCGGKSFCCNGSAWVTNLSLCATTTPTATPTGTATATPTTTPTATPTGTATATPTKTPTATPSDTIEPTIAPVPESGTGWPTILGVGLGVLLLVGSLVLAL